MYIMKQSTTYVKIWSIYFTFHRQVRSSASEVSDWYNTADYDDCQYESKQESRAISGVAWVSGALYFYFELYSLKIKYPCKFTPVVYALAIWLNLQKLFLNMIKFQGIFHFLDHGPPV